MPKKYITLILFIPILALAWLGGTIKADVNDFVVEDFSTEYRLGRDNPHGNMKVSEQIRVNFSDYNHGILRALPASYEGHNLNISDISVLKSDGSKWPVETYSSNGNLVLKIGDPNKTVTGQNSFIINYKLTGPISFYETHDELFWDVNGNDWQQPFKSVSSKLYIPSELANNLKKEQKCFAGSYGETAVYCTIERQQMADGSIVISSQAKDLTGYQTLSFVVAFEKGTFAVYTWKDELKEHIADIVAAVLALSVLLIIFIQWWRKGKDYKGRGVLIAEYKPPKTVDPMRAGIIQDYNLDNRDITAAIIDLAVKGYIKIIESKTQKALFFKSKKYSLELKNANLEKLNEYQDKLMRALFSPLVQGTQLELGSYNSGLATTVRKIGEDLTQKLTDEGYYEQNPKKATNLTAGLSIATLIAIAIISFVLSAPIGGFMAILATVAGIILIGLMPRRSRLGVEAQESLKGLKYYIEVAEKDRIKKLQSAGAQYAKPSREPKKTVELFEKLLPYAIIFGVEKSWAKQFKDIYLDQPDWYQGNMNGFNSVVLTNHIMSNTSAIGSTFAAPSSSGSSGFSGGGGAGGGGGGGGGGGW